jgi:hypothetical protein
LKTRRRFKFDHLRQKFFLTPAEKRVTLFILAAFLLGLGTKYYRDAHPAAPPPQSNLGKARPPGAPSVTPAGKRIRKATPP